MNLNQITIPVKDVEQSILFYQQLGLRLIVNSSPHYARFKCPEGNSTFSLHHVPELTIVNGTWIYFEVQKLESLLSQGTSFEKLPADKPWLWREARLKDPSDHQLILYFAGASRLYPPWRVPSSEA